jgi:streptogramin lyase
VSVELDDHLVLRDCQVIAKLSTVRLPVRSFAVCDAQMHSCTALQIASFFALCVAAALAQSIVEYPVPTAGSQPQGIALGPDGALWFTESNGNKIGRITVDGTITEFPIPTASSDPFGIAQGPDGALWFTEINRNKIGRITVGGVITEYPLPTGNADLSAIAPGPDGALWFTEYTGNKIGRITVGGNITEYPIPTAFQTLKELRQAPMERFGSPSISATRSAASPLRELSPSSLFPRPTLPRPGLFKAPTELCGSPTLAETKSAASLLAEASPSTSYLLTVPV